MENQNFNYTDKKIIQLEDAGSSRKYMANVFLWMFVALALSATCAYVFSTNINVLSYIINPAKGGFTTLGYIALFSPLAFSLVINFGYNRLSYPALVALFLTYSLVIGISISILLLIYTATSVFGVFLTASLLFGIMAVAGYYTHQDLTKFGAILSMLFIGVFIASFVNIFIGGDKLSYIIGYIGTAVFVGLTAYHIQALKRIGAGIEYGNAESKKLSIIGAFTLYTTFINLFFSLMRIFGNRR
jgi:FtsH-binding integral membrane protein